VDGGKVTYSSYLRVEELLGLQQEPRAHDELLFVVLHQSHELWFKLVLHELGDATALIGEDRFPEVGQCVHKVLAHPGRPGRLWQQNHCGVYRSDDGGASWERLDENGLPSPFGFGLALDPSDPDTALVIPEESAENRVTPNGRLGIYRTTDAGASWELIVAEEPAWAAVLREGMSFDGEAVYAGTQSGHVYALRHDEVVEAARHLPPILSVEAAAWQ